MEEGLLSCKGSNFLMLGNTLGLYLAVVQALSQSMSISKISEVVHD